ncbi:nucleotide-binding domain containing protein, partial [uncultured Megasphaera sp.]|uniref:nucleotide-binding domain containing protein n=1 Tax=uncultured Megasphaera sp. TaxID=165188 RepID=UPI0025F30221
ATAIYLGKTIGEGTKATLQQIAWFQERGGLSYKLYPDKILKKEQGLDDIRQFLRAHKDRDVLIYSSETPQYLEEIRGETLLTYSLLIENMLAAAAVIAKEEGVRHIIVAGGETSGAVTKALGYQAYWIGQSIAPGVPIMAPLENPEMRIVLKSGNFGQEEFFGRALTMTGEV